jgi:hypothetical protein
VETASIFTTSRTPLLAFFSLHISPNREHLHCVPSLSTPAILIVIVIVIAIVMFLVLEILPDLPCLVSPSYRFFTRWFYLGRMVHVLPRHQREHRPFSPLLSNIEGLVLPGSICHDTTSHLRSLKSTVHLFLSSSALVKQTPT